MYKICIMYNTVSDPLEYINNSDSSKTLSAAIIMNMMAKLTAPPQLMIQQLGSLFSFSVFFLFSSLYMQMLAS